MFLSCFGGTEMEATLVTFFIFALVVLPMRNTVDSNLVNTELDSQGIPLAHLMARQTFTKRTRQAILEVSQEELNQLIETETYLAVLLQDDSKKCLKTLHDLELIKADSHLFKIAWRKLNVSHSPEAVKNCSIHFYRNGEAAIFPGKSDRQTAVLKWTIKEIYCYMDEPLDVNQGQFEVLIRSFRNFILVLSAPKIKSSRRLVNQFKKQNNWCANTNRLLVVSTQDPNIIKTLELPHRPPLLLHVVHGLYIIYDGNLADMNSILEWINFEVPTNLRVVGASHLDRVISREEVVVVLFIDESTPLLNAALIKAGRELELEFGLAVVDVSDLSIAVEYNVSTFPTVVLHEAGEGKRLFYQRGDLKAESNVTKAAERVQQWIVERLEANDRIVVKAITSHAFKTSPDEFKHVLLKEHKDSMKKISLEYVRIQKENLELKKVIEAAKDVLGTVEFINDQEQEESNGKKKKSRVSDECKDCLSSVGMAVWNCGTFEMDCIKGAIELGSECYPCICEIIDFWWPDDAPNCFKKEIQKITSPPGGSENNNDKTEL